MIRRWIELYATGKTCGPGTYRDLINCVPFLGQHLLWPGNYVQRRSFLLPSNFLSRPLRYRNLSDWGPHAPSV